MSTNAELSKAVKGLTTRLQQSIQSQSQLRDEVVTLKRNYEVLVSELQERLQAIDARFQVTPVNKPVAEGKRTIG